MYEEIQHTVCSVSEWIPLIFSGSTNRTDVVVRIINEKKMRREGAIREKQRVKEWETFMRVEAKRS